MINRRSAWVRLLVAVALSSFCSATAGCSTDGDAGTSQETSREYKVVNGTQLCGGKAVSAEASKALKVITGVSRFQATSERYSVARAAAGLVEAFPVPVWNQAICTIFTPSGAPRFELRVTWGLQDGPPTAKPAREYTVLKMGEKTLASHNKANVFFACRSEQLSSSSRLAHVVVRVEHWDIPSDPGDYAGALRGAYATVAHSFSLAMAKELRCEKNGGLPVRPVLEPA